MAARNEAEREQYRQAARTLREKAEKEADAKGRERYLAYALALERFARTMPIPKTRRQRWLEILRERAGTRPPEKRREQGMER